MSKFGLIYAGAQKNIGPAGLTIVIVREDLTGKAQKGTPSVMDYKQQAAADSMLNTPATYAMYIAGLVFKWLKTQGGLAEIEKRNIAKAKLLYDYLDAKLLLQEFGRQERSLANERAVHACRLRSWTTSSSRAPRSAGMVQLKGHRSVGGMRASIYNAMPVEGVQQLVAYMKEFEAQPWLRPAKKLEVLVLNPIAQVGLKRLPAGALRGGEGIEGARRDPGALGRHARHEVRRQPEGGRARRRRREQHSGEGALQARRAGVQRAGRQRQRGEGAGGRRHADRGEESGSCLGVCQESGFKRFKDLEKKVEAGKKAYAGVELPGHTLGVIGLGKIGSLVADAAIRLGMNVLGYDPEITVDAAWSLPSQVRKAHSVDELLKASDFVTLHVPLVDKTRHLVNAKNLKHMKAGAVLLNFSRDGVVEDAAVLKALESKHLRCYVTDFPSARADRQGRRGGAAAPGRLHQRSRGQLRRHGRRPGARLLAATAPWRTRSTFPNAQMPRESPYRLAIANANVPNMLASISNAMGSRKINIHNMLNKSKGEMAYTLVDVDSPVPEAAIEELCAIKGVLAVRYLPVEA